MTKQEGEILLNFINGNPASNEESIANSLLISIQDAFIETFGNVSCFKYLAVIKKPNDLFGLELSYYDDEPNCKENIAQMVAFIKANLLNQLSIFVTPKIMDFKRFEKVIDTLPIKIEKSVSRFEYHHKNTTVNSEDVNVRNHMVGSRINIKGEKPGALGALLKIKKNNNLYLLTNHHVIIKGKQPLNECVYSNDTCIAQTYWGLYNESYDIAIAKLHHSNFKSGAPDFSFGEIKEVKINDSVSKYGPEGPGSGIIYSSKAVIKVKNKVYKNQILIKDLHLVPGESGTLITSTGERTKDVVGLHFAGDYKLDISNNLYDLFNGEIKGYVDNEGRNHPTIHFDSFY